MGGRHSDLVARNVENINDLCGGLTMIERYSRPEMAAIWTEENKFKAWLEVEFSPVRLGQSLALSRRKT